MSSLFENLLGRDSEKHALTAFLAGVGDRGGATSLVGDAGIGKSTLLHAAAQHAEDLGFAVIDTAGVASERTLPLAGLHQLLMPVLGKLDTLAPAQRRVLLTAFGMHDGPPPELFLIALAALNLLSEAASERPLLLVVDDVQWLDEPSETVLTFVARRVGRDPIAVLGAFRPGHDGPFATAGFPELIVRGLGEDAARQVLAANAADLGSTAQEEILRTSLGNPLALVELPAAWRAAGAPATRGGAQIPALTARLERTFAGRLPVLPQLTRDLLLIAALATRDELPEILAAASTLAGVSATVEDLEPAVRARLVQLDPVRISFCHPLIRSAVELSESLGRRLAAHGALAGAVGADAYRRTWHRAHSIVGTDDGVADELDAGHTVALSRGSVISAIWALERSAELTVDSARRGRRRLLAAEHAFGLGRPEIIGRLITAVAHDEPSAMEAARVELLRETLNEVPPGDTARVLRLCESARDAHRAGDTSLALDLLNVAALRCWWADTGAQSRAEVARALDELDEAVADPRHLAALACAEPILRGAEVCGRLARLEPESIDDPAALRLIGTAAHAVGDQVRAAAYLDRAENLLRERGQMGLLPLVLGVQCAVRLDLGDWARIDAALAEGRRIAAETDQPFWGDGQIINEARLVGLRGDLDRAFDLADQSFAHPIFSASNVVLACAQLARGYALLSAGRHSEAFDAFVIAFDPASSSFHPRERIAAVMFVAETARHAGRFAEGREIIEQLEQVAQLTPAPMLRLHLQYARAVLAEDFEAESRFQTALAAPELMRWPWVRARTELAFGTWLRRQRRSSESRAYLRSAAIVFDAIGAGAWSRLAAAELRAAGERPRIAPRDSPLAVLSPQELQIATLAARGLSNREIGEQLFLSHRTVGSHLYRTFPKLGITTRAQLSDRLNTTPPASGTASSPE
ncbi:AAA family ATPase [Nocardia sp. NBC_00511]|uniref:helix-turn-helix transcriptional regulator n=1 Tax=Nocardia sp. NBC_00511 TaxID=2903591 RepID=UPI0038642733